MKKKSLPIYLGILLFSACLLFLLPFVLCLQLKQVRVVLLAAPTPALLRKLAEPTSWWPEKGTHLKPNTSLNYGMYHYRFKPIDISLQAVLISDSKDTFNTQLYISSLGLDSTKLVWLPNLKFSANPLTCLREYCRFRRLLLNADSLFASIKTTFSNYESLYGFAIHTLPVVDTAMLTTYMRTPEFPSPERIYSLINKLKKHAFKWGAKQTNYPMFYVYDKKNGLFNTVLALPVNRLIPSTTDLFQKRIPPGVLTLFTDVQGGPHTCQRAFEALRNYALDHRYNLYVIPYASLVTDRLKEADSSRWSSRIYYPVF